MGEPEKPEAKPRTRFQFSLLTAIVAMLAAGVLLGLNMRPLEECLVYPKAFDNMIKNWQQNPSYGWPFVVLRDLGKSDGEDVDSIEYITGHSKTKKANCLHRFEKWNLVFDISIGIAILSIFAVCSESLVRRSDRRRQAKREGAKP
jgi:hypothetical protein